MASRYHWIETSYDTGFLGGGYSFPNLDAAIPAGATMKRFVVRNCSIFATGTGTGYQTVNNLIWRATVDIISGAYSPRNIYLTRRRVPMNVVALYDTPTTQRIYTQYVCAGDQDLGINEKTSYGLASGPGFTVRLATRTIQQAGTLAGPTGDATCQFRVLYYL